MSRGLVMAEVTRGNLANLSSAMVSHPVGLSVLSHGACLLATDACHVTGETKMALPKHIPLGLLIFSPLLKAIMPDPTHPDR